MRIPCLGREREPLVVSGCSSANVMRMEAYASRHASLSKDTSSDMASISKKHLRQSQNMSLCEYYSRSQRYMTGKLSNWTLKPPFSTQCYMKKSTWNSQKASKYRARVGE